MQPIPNAGNVKFGAKVIAKVRDERPDQYLKTAATLVPREHTLEASDDMKDFLREMNSGLMPDDDT